MKTIVRVIGILMWAGAGLIMFVFWFMAMSDWLGFIGSILAFVLAPGVIIFPIAFWIIEGVFPFFYFIIWGIGIAGLIIFSSVGEND